MWYLQIAALLYKFLAFSLVYVDALVTDCFAVAGEKAGAECLSVNELSVNRAQCQKGSKRENIGMPEVAVKPNGRNRHSLKKLLLWCLH